MQTFFGGGVPLSEDLMRMNIGAMNCKIFSDFQAKKTHKTHSQKQHTKTTIIITPLMCI